MTGYLLAANFGLLVTVLVWGMPIPLFEILLKRWDPFVLALLRYLIAVPLLLALLAIWRPSTPRLKPEQVSWCRLFLLGAGISGFGVFFMLGLDNSDPVSAAILAAATPVIAGGVNWLCYGERPARGLGVSLVFAVAGGSLAGIDLSAEGGGPSWGGGEPLIVVAVICWSWYSITVQRWMPGCSQLQLTALTVTPACIILMAVCLVLAAVDLVTLRPSELRHVDMVLIVWIGISNTVIGIVAWNFGVNRLGVVVASMYLNLIPVVAVLTAAALGITARSEQIAGGILVIIGLLQAQLRNLIASRRAATRNAVGQ